jgi:hypothetical protein
MKKIYFVLLLALFNQNSQAQTYFRMLDKDTTTWQHFHCFMAVEYKSSNANFNLFSQPIAAIDSMTINGNLYKKVYELMYYNINYTNKQMRGYMREDTIARRVYFRETISSPEILVYDFSLNVNDSVQLTFPANAGDNGYYRLDSIKTKNERCGLRRHFYMRKHMNNSQPTIKYLDWIESIGASFHVLYPYASQYMQNFGGCNLPSSATCNHPWMVGVTCKHNKLVKQYQSCTYAWAQQTGCMTVLDSCNYHSTCGSIREDQLPSYVSIFPNPAKEDLSVKFMDGQSHSLVLELFDLTGKMLFRIKKEEVFNNSKIDLRNIEEGYYLLRMQIDGQYYSQPLMIEP